MASIRPLAEAVLILEEIRRRASRRVMWTMYPDDGPLRRELYPKHLEFFEAGGQGYSERAFIAANRIGKTWGVGAYECALHLTGCYPDWWVGVRFDRPVSIWAAGDTGKTTRDIIQLALLGRYGEFGTGMVPGDLIIGDPRAKSGVAEAVEIFRVRHTSGGVSHCTLKSYDQRREGFQGTAQDIVWLDEEPPKDIYDECLLRTMTTGGHMLCTFTPLMGWSDVVRSYLQPDAETDNDAQN